MIELKDASIEIDGKCVLDGLSFQLHEGQVVGIDGGDEYVRTAILYVFLGLKPLSAGYATVDGEPILPSTSAIYRGMMSFVPRESRMNVDTVAELFDTMLTLSLNEDLNRPKKRLFSEWKRLGVATENYVKHIEDVSDEELRLMMLGYVGMAGRSIVLLDSPTFGVGIAGKEIVADYVRSLARNGAAVLVATSDKDMLSECDRVIDLHTYK